MSELNNRNSFINANSLIVDTVAGCIILKQLGVAIEFLWIKVCCNIRPNEMVDGIGCS